MCPVQSHVCAGAHVVSCVNIRKWKDHISTRVKQNQAWPSSTCLWIYKHSDLRWKNMGTFLSSCGHFYHSVVITVTMGTVLSFWGHFHHLVDISITVETFLSLWGHYYDSGDITITVRIFLSRCRYFQHYFPVFWILRLDTNVCLNQHLPKSED